MVCIQELTRPPSGVWPDAATTEADRDWFDERPYRKHRLRWATEEEIALINPFDLASMAPADFVIAVVRRLNPDYHARFAMCWDGSLPEGEDAARKVFNRHTSRKHRRAMEEFAKRRLRENKKRRTKGAGH